MKILFGITTANQLEYTIKCLESLKLNAESCHVDVIVADDCSNDGTQDYLKKQGVELIQKNKPKGVTDSWNLIYREFKQREYDCLIISNNDILIPSSNFFSSITTCLESAIILGTLCNRRGVPFNESQAAESYMNKQIDVDLPENYNEVHNHLSITNKGKLLSVESINGYFMCFSKGIHSYEFQKDLLFDPSNVNVNNEDELCKRVTAGKKILLDCFVYHYKGVSFEQFDKGRIKLDRNFTWDKAAKMKEGTLSFFWYRMRRKLKKMF